jgi:hypothetical protein
VMVAYIPFMVCRYEYRGFLYADSMEEVVEELEKDKCLNITDISQC